jgi:kinetochore protein NDC80
MKASRMSLGMPMVMQTSISSVATAKRMSLTVSASSSNLGANQNAQATARRASIAPRSSSLSTVSRLNDPRNINDKAFISASIRSLIEFLTERAYDQPISPKILTKPTNKDYHNIVLFLFRQIDPNYVPTGKIEDEIVSMFRFLGYPFPVAKSHISAVGSPHAWPNLLATIMWLIELLRYDEAVVKSNELEESYLGSAGVGEDDDVAEEERNFYRYLTRAYSLFINNRDDAFQHLSNQFVASYQHKNTLVQDQIEALDQKNAAVAGDIEEVKRRSAMVPELDSRRREIARELEALEKHVKDRQEESEELVQRIGGKEREWAELKTRTTGTNKEIAVLRDKIATQEISPEDVVNMVSERERLEDACAAASQHRQGMQRRLVEVEMVMRDKAAALEDMVRAYHTIAEDMKMVPQSARNSRGENLRIELNIATSKREELLTTQVKAHIVPILHDLKRELVESTLSLRGELLGEKETLEELQQREQQLHESLDSFDQRIKRAEQTYKREKEALESAAELQRHDWDEAELRLLSLRDTAAEEARINTANRRLAEIQAVHRAKLSECEAKKAAMLEDIMEVVASCASHREAVQTGLEEVKHRYGRRLETFLAAPPMVQGY